MQKDSKFPTKEKRDLLFLHGYLSTGDSFAFQKDFFSQYFNVYTPDLKGFGKNAIMEYPYSLDDYVNDVKKYVIENHLNKPDVIAHSFGGRIAIKLASKDKDFFGKIVLTGSAGLKPKRTLKKSFKRLLFKTLKLFIDKNKLAFLYSSDYNMLDEVMKESFHKIINEHLDDRLSSIENQTLIVFGEKDDQTPVYMAKRLNEGISNSKLILIKDAGHFSFIDKPKTFNMEVREFLLS